MNDTTFRLLDEAIAPLETWESDDIPFPFGVVGIDDNGREEIGGVNLADFIGATSTRANETLLFERRDEWNDCENPKSRKELVAHIVMACAVGGFNVQCKGWEKKLSRLVFRCQRGSQCMVGRCQQFLRQNSVAQKPLRRRAKKRFADSVSRCTGLLGRRNCH